ncbi:MAG: hypothetical protein A2W61_02695 [Deltaproteobacteria bacterium RIFCSPLOWO2_01_44_7]|nr:MAG: hypothetical protein A2712_05740 [Deltaproteobacteria bacterium RIFCSPHIGHO2_01_FULL_43_49]OGQ14297.1 MAG: hypothetical protein A3D22_04645 [Deltaproteobacteria bacterium RIFCSPHIGHO2_02_FULL_44_53]OGQ27663.1 MAG: hypothetical protein A3D98_09530 [Deltaproteobacteria bacterium RIFCSPHIGHO2_12_FULL_44_21]OGQ30738.1 MAG: hypothetical protein A2979_01055 [Deltaproteobacteria bacterium RIFCSPLOWO2_01_FULL_45_74]OGQ42418.1 MAG: hypothetical protein A3I70_10580 [Deltaproteobacteria bacterium 
MSFFAKASTPHIKYRLPIIKTLRYFPVPLTDLKDQHPQYFGYFFNHASFGDSRSLIRETEAYENLWILRGPTHEKIRTLKLLATPSARLPLNTASILLATG